MALYRPKVQSPSNDTYDAANNYDFTTEIDGGTCYGYQLYIDSVDVDDGTELQIYDSTLIDITSAPINDGETLTKTVPSSTITNTSDYYYKWRIDLYEDTGLTSSITSYEFIFYGNKTPVLDFDGGTPLATVTSSVYDFLGTYTQEQDIAINYWEVTLYDRDAVTVLYESGIQYGTYLYYQFGGLENGGEYYVQFTTTNQSDIVTVSSLEYFDVSFTSLVANNTLEAVNNEMTAGIDLTWSPFTYVLGTSTNPPAYSTLPGYPNRETVEPGVLGVQFSVDMNNAFTIGGTIYIPSHASYNDYIFKVSNTGGSGEAGIKYNSTGGIFSLVINGSVVDTLVDSMGATDVRNVAMSKSLSTYEWTVFV